MAYNKFLITILGIFFWVSLLNAEDAATASATDENTPSTIMDWRYWNLEYTRSDISVLPNGNHNFSPLEYWFPGAILSNPDNGGFSVLEPVTLAIHGESWKWNRYHLNSMDITNPADPGRPFIYLPIDLWKSYHIISPVSSMTDNFGLNWTVEQKLHAGGMVSFGTAGFLGGETWIPANFMDREPAQGWGAAEKRRSMAPSPEGSARFDFTGIGNMPASVFYEGISQKRTFTTLDGYENGNRHTVYAGQNMSENTALSALYQHLDRDHLGIETGNLDSHSLHGASDAILLTLAAINPEAEKFTYGINAGYGHSRFEQNNDNPMVLDLVDQVVYGKIPEPKDSKTWFVSNNLNFNNLADIWIFDFSVFSRIRFEGVHEQNLYKSSMIAHSFYGAPYDVIYYNTNNTYSQYLARINPEAVFEKKWNDVNLRFEAGLLFENGFSNDSSLLTRFDPVASIRFFSNPGNKWEFFTGIQHDAIPVSSDELKFLNPTSPSGGRYVWNDNGNGIPENGETGAIYNSTGGKYHTLSADMKYPTRDELYLGLIHNFNEKWRALFSLHGKRYANLYFVDYDPSIGSAGYNEIDRPDVLGGVLYNRDVAAMGNELYMLGNSVEDAYYAAAEFEILKMNKGNDPWFFQFTIGAYYSQAKTIVGNGPEYNDMGQFSESSADPNSQINTLAITDSDRGYIVNFLFGLNLGSFSLANSLRYRDGQPFGNMAIVEGLTQGPTIIQNGNRSNPPEGIPRFTFALTWDVRMKFEFPRDKVKTALSFDVYNLFDSRTELYEYTIQDERYRDPIETVTGRSFRLMMHMYW